MTPADLLKIMPYAKPRIAAFFSPLVAAMEEFEINTPARRAAFLAQVGHESGQLARVEENLNYSAAGLMKTWPRRFHAIEVATQYARQPQKIANYVYANRCGNGDEASGDGWRHRGAGLIQLTFKENQQRCADYFGISIIKIGDWLRTPEGACRSAGWFWKRAGCNRMADYVDFDAISDAINIGRQTEAEGDAIGYADRLALFKVAQEVLA